MKKSINRMLVLLSLLAIVLTLGLITAVYYKLFQNQITADLKDYTVLLRRTGENLPFQELGPALLDSGIRLTLVDESGNVLYDNEVDSGELENHMGRPEIRGAFRTGEGQSIRNSRTLSRSTFYYAVRLEDGSVLRVAKDAGSMVSIFSSVLPTILWITAFLALLSLGISHLLTGRLVRPIEKLAENMESGAEPSEYEELAPFIKMIQEQHRTIVKNAKMRQEFTANVSHELKTPLTSISGYAELIETGMADRGDVTRFAGGIRSSANRLLALINDIIRLSELDSPEGSEVFENLNLGGMAADCVEMLKLNAEKHNVTIAFSGEDRHIEGDRRMIEELLYNLCDNGIRYNNAGGRVDVKVFRDDSRPERPVVLSVKDTGIGIPKEHQERIFERFYTVDKSRSKSTGGTGLGLAIVKHIVAKHGAGMELSSEIGRGTEIKVIFREAVTESGLPKR